MIKSVLGVASDKGISVLKPGKEETNYVLASKGLMGRRCNALIRAGDGRLAAGTDDFFVQMSPDGNEWKPSMEGLTRPQITALARHPQHKHILFAATSPPGVFVSADYGSTWRSLAPLESMPSSSRWSYPEAPYRAKVTSVACHPEHSSVLFCSIENGDLAASKDGGKTWINRGKGLPPSVRDLIIPGNSKSRIYAATSTGFFRSEDLAATWQQFNAGLPFTKVEAMAVAASNPQVLLLSVSAGVKGASTVVLSTNGGDSWAVANSGLPRLDERRITCLTFGKGGFYAGSSKGEIFFLNNLDGRWLPVASNLEPVNALISLT